MLEINYRGETLTFLTTARERILASYLHHQTVCPIDDLVDLVSWLSRYPEYRWEDFEWLADRCMAKVKALEVVHDQGYCFIPTVRILT